VATPAAAPVVRSRVRRVIVRIAHPHGVFVDPPPD
jgi:hypothetical protein